MLEGIIQAQVSSMCMVEVSAASRGCNGGVRCARRCLAPLRERERERILHLQPTN